MGRLKPAAQQLLPQHTDVPVQGSVTGYGAANHLGAHQFSTRALQGQGMKDHPSSSTAVKGNR